MSEAYDDAESFFAELARPHAHRYVITGQQGRCRLCGAAREFPAEPATVGFNRTLGREERKELSEILREAERSTA